MRLSNKKRNYVAQFFLDTGLLLGVCSSVFMAAPPIASGQDVIIADDEGAVVSQEEGAVVSTDEEEVRQWTARSVVLGPFGGQEVFTRLSTEAFVDPDSPRELELKYYFQLDSEASQLFTAAHARPAASTPGKLVAPAAKDLPAGFPLTFESAEGTPEADLAWVDYQAKEKARRVAVILNADAASTSPTLCVLEVEPQADGWHVRRVAARRDLSADAVAKDCLPGGRLDTWDRPPELGKKANFFGRVIAVLTQANGRYAVDFYGEKLHADSDCRVWLTPIDHEWGQPVAIRFTTVPLKRQTDEIVQQSVLAVLYKQPDGGLRTIAFDYPLCNVPALQQMRQLASGRSGSRPAGGGLDVTKILGEDVIEEFECRLVDATYR